MDKKKIIALVVMVAAIAFGTFVFITSTLYAPSDAGGVPDEPLVLSAPLPPNTGDPRSSTVSSSSSVSQAQTLVTALPTRLIIPSIGVDAHVQYVGVTRSGNMATPNNFTDVGWYEYGTIPGNIGSAVIAGHVDNGLSLPGVFKHLTDISLSDDIYVKNASGTLRFVVDSVDYYDYRSVPAAELFHESDTARIKLITCTGDWIQEERTYNKRIVVSAHLLE